MLKCIYTFQSEKNIILFNNDFTYKLYPSLKIGKWNFSDNILKLDNICLYYNYNYSFKNIELEININGNSEILKYFYNFIKIDNNPDIPKSFFISKFINFNN